MELFIQAFLIVNAIFWGLFPHSAHCKLIKDIFSIQCSDHWKHILFGLFFYLCAIYISQRKYINSLLN